MVCSELPVSHSCGSVCGQSAGCASFSDPYGLHVCLDEVSVLQSRIGNVHISNAVVGGHAERFGYLRTCVEPDWQAFSTSQHTARAKLIELAEWLGCRDRPHLLPRPEALCLARGATAVLAAFEAIGGPDDMLALYRADPAAAACLCYGLIQAVGDVRSRRMHSNISDGASRNLQCVGPDLLSAAAADLRQGAPGFWQRACAAGWLADSCVLNCIIPDEQRHLAGHTKSQAIAAWQMGLHACGSVQSLESRPLNLYIALLTGSC
jgi:hypothetical protein